VTVELRREELVIEREALEETAAVPGEAPPVPEPLVLTLSEEQAVITKVVVPLERVRISVDRITEEHELRTTLRSEQVDVVGEPPPA
jgi:stress response protein YsnF